MIEGKPSPEAEQLTLEEMTGIVREIGDEWLSIENGKFRIKKPGRPESPAVHESFAPDRLIFVDGEKVPMKDFLTSHLDVLRSTMES